MTDEQTTATATRVRTAPAPSLTVASVSTRPAAGGAPVPPPDSFTFAGRRPATKRAAPAEPPSTPARGAQLLWAAVTVAVAVLSAFFVLIVSGRVVTEGPVVLVLTRTHGIHLGDLFALAAWGLAVLALLASAWASTRARGVRSRR